MTARPWKRLPPAGPPPPPFRCVECGREPEWAVFTAGGWISLCQPHADWYLAKGSDIYPSSRYPRPEPPRE